MMLLLLLLLESLSTIVGQKRFCTNRASRSTQALHLTYDQCERVSVCVCVCAFGMKQINTHFEMDIKWHCLMFLPGSPINGLFVLIISSINETHAFELVLTLEHFDSL